MSNKRVFLVPVAGGEATRVTRQYNPFCERLAWTADGRELVFSTTGGAPESSSSLWRVSASGGTPQPVFVGGDNAANQRLQAGETGSPMSNDHRTSISGGSRYPRGHSHRAPGRS
jgi:Tol biopolymer transport system component